MVVLQTLIALLFAIFLCYQIYALVRDIIARKKKKGDSPKSPSDHKEDEK